MKKTSTLLLLCFVVLGMAMTGCGNVKDEIKSKIDDYNDDNSNTNGDNNGNTISLARAVDATNPVVGDWGTGMTGTDTFAISFYPNGTYIMWDKGANGGTGVEYGIFSAAYNGNSWTVTVTSTLDDQQDNPATPDQASGLTEYSGQTKTMTLTALDQNTIQVGSGAETFTLHRAVGANNPIVGSWGTGEHPDFPSMHVPLMLVFYPNGTYIHYEAQTSATCQPGAEYGTYTYDAATGTLTTKATEDRNGDVGLANGNGTGSTLKVIVTGDIITFY